MGRLLVWVWAEDPRFGYTATPKHCIHCTKARYDSLQSVFRSFLLFGRVFAVLCFGFCCFRAQTIGALPYSLNVLVFSFECYAIATIQALAACVSVHWNNDSNRKKQRTQFLPFRIHTKVSNLICAVRYICWNSFFSSSLFSIFLLQCFAISRAMSSVHKQSRLSRWTN